MPVVTQMHDLMDLVLFPIWCLVVWGVANAVFRSYPAAALKTWLWASQKNRREIQILQWEVQNRMAYDENFARGDTMVKPAALTPAEITARQQRVIQLAKASRWRRVVNYLLQCTFCQHAWASLGLFVAFAPYRNPWAEVVPTVMAYSALTTILLGRFSVPAPAAPAQRVGGCSGGCAKHR